MQDHTRRGVAAIALADAAEQSRQQKEHGLHIYLGKQKDIVELLVFMPFKEILGYNQNLADYFEYFGYNLK